jgi:hypothetical protein
MFSVAVPPDVVTGSQVRPDVEVAQVRVTAPAKPPEGVTEIVEVALAPGLAIVAEVAASVKDGTGAVLTVSGMVVEAVILPVAASAPVTATE